MSDNINVRFTGDNSGLLQMLQQSGRAVEDFGGKASKGLKQVESSSDRTAAAGIKLSDVLSLLSVRSAARFGFKALTGELTQFEQTMVTAQIQAQKLTNTLSFAVGKENAGRDLTFLREKSQDLGLEFISTAQQYARLAASSRGTNMEGKQTRELFESIAEASAVMGMSVEESEGAFRAVQQMMSKGKVQAEELRGQLGERLPGAFQIAARAMGVTTAQLDKMLERGEVYADDFLPRFAAQLKKELGGSVADASLSAQAASNRFTNAYTELKQSLADSGVYDLVASRQNKAAESFNTWSASMRQAKEDGGGFLNFLSALGRAFAQDISLTNPFTGVSASAKENAANLEAAKIKLQELQAQGERRGNNIYWKSEVAEVARYVEALELALQKKKQLSAGDMEAETRAQFPTRGQSYEREEKRLAANRARVDGIRQRLTGQNENFQANLQELYKQHQAGTPGVASVAEYRDLVAQLIKTDGGIKKAEKVSNPADAVFRGISERTAELRLSQTAQDGLTAAQKYASKVLDDMRMGTLKLSESEKARMGVSLQVLLIEDQANTERERAKKLQEENAKIVEKNTEAVFKHEEARQKALDGEIETNRKMREEISLIGLDEGQRAARLQMIERETIARLELDLVMARNIEGQEGEASRLERELELRKQRVDMIGEKGLKEEAAKRSESITDSITDGMLNGFREGRSLSQIALDELKAQWGKTILQPMIRPLVDIGNKVITDMLGGAMGSTKVGDLMGGTGGGFGGLLSGFAGLFGGSATAAFSGTALGASGFGSGLAFGNMDLGLNFEGGGYTGSGPRSGGLDGKGGFMAMVHPDETVVDHAKGQTLGGTTVVNNYTFGGGVSRSEVMAGMQQVLAQARTDRVEDGRRRRN